MMKGKVILICGKIGSGKTFYTHQLIESTGAVLLSQDELMRTMFSNDIYHTDPEFYAHEVDMANLYTRNLAAAIARSGGVVILDNGFWGRGERQEYMDFYKKQGIDCEIHYMDTPEEIRIRNVHERNARARAGLVEDFIVREEDIDHYFDIPDETENVTVISWKMRCDSISSRIQTG